VVDLFKESWDVFQRRFSTLIGLFLLSVLAFVGPGGAAVALGMVVGMVAGKVVMVAIGMAGMVASIYLGFRCLAGFLHAVADEGLCLKDALGRGKGMVLPLAWVGLLTGFVISGGFMLLVIPGIVFMVWFCFAQFVLVCEDSRGMDALLKSKEYIRGEWFNVALRLLLVWAASLLVGAIPLAGPILSIVFLPYLTIFHYLIYRDLREIKGDVPFACGISDKVKWPGAALVGYLVFPVVLFSILGASILGALGPIAQLASKEGITLQPAAPAPKAAPDQQGYRVITFPQQAPAAPGTTAPGTTEAGTTAAGGAAVSPSPASQGVPAQPQASGDEEPKDVSIFIYAANYTGTVRANGAVLKELEGKPDVQYNYNMFGRSLRYGPNQIEVNYAELPSHQQSLLSVHIKISRHRQGKEREILGEWKIDEKGSGTKNFTLDIPR